MQGSELQRPLRQAELDELSAFLSTTPGAMSLSEARGFLTAIASAPTTMMPSAWQPVLLGDSAFASMEQAKRVFGLVMRLYNQIVTALTDGSPIAPVEADEAIGSWCAGYLRAARMDDVWTADETGVAFLFPLGVLAGDVDLVGEQDSSGRIIDDPAPQLRRCRELLDDTVHDANRYWTAWRRRRMATPVAAAAPKTGRNEPCPCGSGRKFKKCCALKEQ
jgi:uncharacterized protein